MAGTKNYVVMDGFGRRTVFHGEHLISDTTDSADGRKPQWLEIDIWRTEAGAFVVRKVVRYRVVHASPMCPRLEGFEVVEPLPTDDYPCRTCNPEGRLTSGTWAQAPRTSVDVYAGPPELIEGMKVEGRYTRLSRALLADLSEMDDRVDALWNTVEVP